MSHTSEFLSTQEEELRIVIVGRHGTGKSSSGNTILGQKCFKINTWMRLSPYCYKGSAVVDGQHISVVDTPEELIIGLYPHPRLMDQCVRLSAPGPHVFLVVSRLDGFTKEEKQMMQDMREMFSPDVDRCCMVLFTGGDQLEDTMEELLDRSPDHRDLVAQYYNRYHVFNNKLKDRSQVTELLHKIRNMVQENMVRDNRGYYTNEKFQEVMRKKEEEERLSQTEEEKRGGQRAEWSCNII